MREASTSGDVITSVLFTTAGTGSGKSYTPKEFTVSMTLAGPPLAGPGVSYEVEATTNTCGTVVFTYEPGTAYQKLTGRSGWATWGRCPGTDGDSKVELLAPEVVGNKITWTFGLKSTALKVGTVFQEFHARVDPSNPAVPLPSEETGSALGLIDAATGTGTWKLG